MYPVTRLNDLGFGVCIAHPPVVHSTVGRVITSQSTVLINNKPCARMLDKVMTDCGGVGTIIDGAPTVFVGGLMMSRSFMTHFVGTFTGIIITGSDNVYCLV